MKSASLYLFCCPEDIRKYLLLLCAEYKLDAAVFCLGENDGFAKIFTPDEHYMLSGNTFRIFLFPPPIPIPLTQGFSIGDVRCIDWGWIDIRPGRIFSFEHKNILTETQIYGSDTENGNFQATKAIAWLKRRIKHDVKFGITGFNPNTNGSSVYKNTGYTELAENIINDGGSWKTGEKYPSIFYPTERHLFKSSTK